jgi:hypothetical protein
VIPSTHHITLRANERIVLEAGSGFDPDDARA